MKALKNLSMPDLESRSSDFEGRRLVRVDGGFIILNYFKYRDKDHTAPLRMKRYRAKKRAVDVTRNGVDDTRNVTQAEEEAESDAKTEAERSSSNFFLPEVSSFLAELVASGRYVDPEKELRSMQRGSGKLTLAHFKNILKKRPLAERPPETPSPSYEDTFRR
jgi:hypothetical protein